MPPKRILVVGSSGLIGSALVGEYARQGATVVGTRRNGGAVRGVAAGQEVIEVDLMRPETFDNVHGEYDAVFMCSAMTSIVRCEDAPEETSLLNVSNTLQLLQHISRHSARIIFLSSSAVFGPDAAGRDEKSATGSPSFAYGRQKSSVETALLAENARACVVRITKVLSKTLPLMQKFTSELKSSQECRPYANLFMAPVSLQFIVDALVKVEESGEGGVFHISGEQMISYVDFVRSFAMHFGYPTNKVVEATMSIDAIPSPMESKAYALLCMDRTTELLNIFPQPLSSVLADL